MDTRGCCVLIRAVTELPRYYTEASRGNNRTEEESFRLKIRSVLKLAFLVRSGDSRSYRPSEGEGSASQNLDCGRGGLPRRAGGVRETPPRAIETYASLSQGPVNCSVYVSTALPV